MTSPYRLDETDKLLSWASLIEDRARDQVLQAATMPFVWPHVAVMPDVHWGLGCSVGTVYPTIGAIVPACVGVDIGCGMIAARTSLRYEEIRGRDLAKLRNRVEQLVPMSVGNYNASYDEASTHERVRLLSESSGGTDAYRTEKDWPLQLGSLGGGNHFIEFCRGREGNVWIFLHSGSRGVGNRLARQYIRLASELCAKWWITLPNSDLAYLPENTQEFWDYLRVLGWAQKFAWLNRDEMLDRCCLALSDWAGTCVSEYEEVIRCHHNYTEQMPKRLAVNFRSNKSTGTGQTVWLTRKGAIDASEGTPGLIPGSMGAKSYIVSGLGNNLSLWSAPHGAGRRYGRNHAKSLYSTQQLTESMRDIEWCRDIANDLRDEHPDAYKNIDTVMHDARSLVEVTNELTQFVNIKGA